MITDWTITPIEPCTIRPATRATRWTGEMRKRSITPRLMSSITGMQRATVHRHLTDAAELVECAGHVAVALGLGQLDVDGVATQVGLEPLGRALGHHATAVHDRELRGEVVGLLEVVGGEQDREALVARQA